MRKIGGEYLPNVLKQPSLCIIYIYVYGCWMKNRGVKSPKWMVKIMENLKIKMDDLGVPLFFGNTHLCVFFPNDHCFTKGLPKPEKLRWLAGKSPYFLIGDTSTHSWLFSYCHVSLQMFYKGFIVLPGSLTVRSWKFAGPQKERSLPSIISDGPLGPKSPLLNINPWSLT